MPFPNLEISAVTYLSNIDQKRQLVDWVYAEMATIGVEDSVNAKITESIQKEASSSTVMIPEPPNRPRPERLREDPDDSWTSNAPSLAFSAAAGTSRSQRITFERGWDVWWIRDAIRQIVDVEEVTEIW